MVGVPPLSSFCQLSSHLDGKCGEEGKKQEGDGASTSAYFLLSQMQIFEGPVCLAAKVAAGYPAKAWQAYCHPKHCKIFKWAWHMICVCVCVSFGSLVRYIHAHKCTHMRTWVCVSIIKISLVTHLHIFIIYRFLKGLPVVIVVQLKVKTHKSLLNSAQFLVLFLSFVFVNKWSMRVREQRTQEELFTITLFLRVSCL